MPDTSYNANNSLNKINDNETIAVDRDFYIGLSLAIISSFFIGSSFILKKKGLIKLSSNFNDINAENKIKTKRAAQGGHGYLKEWLWWSGFLTMGLGEICNFTAYGFVPATLVTPLGALSVLVSAVLAAHFLDEKLNAIGKIGCALTAIGSTVMVIHAPKEGEVKNLSELLSKLMDIEFVLFVLITIISLIVLIYVLAPKHGNSNILVYILICSILGSYTVMSCKGVSLGIKELISGKPTVPYVYTSAFVLIACICMVVQINYLNKSLDVFNTAIVTTVYYVLFSLFVMIASSVLFKELYNVSFKDFVGCICGFSTVICALCLIHFFKSDEKIQSFKNSFSVESGIKESDLFNNSDVESTTDSVPISNNQGINFETMNNNGLFENLRKTNDSQNYEEFSTYSPSFQKNVKFQGLNIEKNIKNTNFSFINYINDNYKQLETKYISRFKNHNLLSYNYNQLKSNDCGEAMVNNSSNQQYISNDINNNKLKSLRYYNPCDKNIEQQSNLLEQNDEINDFDENAHLNV